MSTLFLIVIALLLALIAAAGYWYFRRWRQASIAADILNDPNPLASWTYTPQEWQQAVTDEFDWANAGGGSAQVRISQRGVYVWSDSDSRVYELETGPKVVTFAGYVGIEGSPLKFRVRWKIVGYHEDGEQKTKYYKEDYRIPVPFRVKDEAEKVVRFFQQRLENNLDAYTAVIPDDQPISLFGKDSF